MEVFGAALTAGAAGAIVFTKEGRCDGISEEAAGIGVARSVYNPGYHLPGGEAFLGSRRVVVRGWEMMLLLVLVAVLAGDF